MMNAGMEFLNEDNVAGRQLLVICSRGSSIITELLRLSSYVPSPFLIGHPGNAQELAERKKYSQILFDFSYLSRQGELDETIDNTLELLDMDEEFRENNYDLLGRFYSLFESIFRYISDLQQYVEELQENAIVHYTLETVLLDFEGCQLLAEAIYLYGVMLLLLDMKIPGSARERMIVAYFRYMGSQVENIQEVVRLCRQTGFVRGGSRPAKYPESFFARFPLPRNLLDMAVGRLRTEDIYNCTSSYGTASSLRSLALSTQSSMLYVIMFFIPDLLYNNKAVMREIVDKHFPDNWVIPFYMGYTVDLASMWNPYPAAQAALKNILTRSNIMHVTESHVKNLVNAKKGLKKYLTEGVLLDDYVLDHISPLLNQVRSCNYTLRWTILHRTTDIQKYREYILKAISTKDLVYLMNHTAQFEFQLKTIVNRLIEEKQNRWDQAKQECVGRMQELSEYFSGNKALTRVEKNAQFEQWFKFLGDEIASLDMSNQFVSGRKIGRINEALEEVEEYEQIYSSLQIKQFLDDTRKYMKQMIRTVNVNGKVQSDLDVISDFSYAAGIIKDYTPYFHQLIKQDQKIVLVLKATFKKLASLLDKPLVRISMAESKDDVSVAEYHSTELVKYVRLVLDVVPKSVFGVLDDIIKILTHRLKAFPTKLERQYLKDYAQLDTRYMLSNLTHQVSVFTEGVLSMKTTLVGIIKLDPKEVLEDGIRKELVRQVAIALNEFLVFKTGRISDFETRLTMLGQKLDGYKQSFEYIQDYINMYGLKIWQEEFSRIIYYNVEQECNTFLKQKVYDWQSQYQSDTIPIPRFPPIAQPNEEMSVGFMGRLVRQLLAQTAPSNTVYVESQQGWYDSKFTEVVGIRTFSILARACGVFGLNGVDRLLSFMIVRDLTTFVRTHRKNVTDRVKGFVSKLTAQLQPTSQFPPNAQKLYAIAQSKTVRLWPLFSRYIVFIGQAQLLRRQIANELNFSAKLDSKMLSCALETLNTTLINDVKNHYARPDSKPYPGNPILPDITSFLETSGVTKPVSKIYITTEEALDGIAVLLFLFVLSEVQKLKWNRRLSTLVKSNEKVAFDGAPFVVGIATVLKQFHSSHTHTFLAYLGQYIRSTISAAAPPAKSAKVPGVVINLLYFLEEFCKFSAVDRHAIESVVPPYLFDRFSV